MNILQHSHEILNFFRSMVLRVRYINYSIILKSRVFAMYTYVRMCVCIMPIPVADWSKARYEAGRLLGLVVRISPGLWMPVSRGWFVCVVR